MTPLLPFASHNAPDDRLTRVGEWLVYRVLVPLFWAAMIAALALIALAGMEQP